jgi:hypothetical protein
MYYAELDFPSIPDHLLVDRFESVENQESSDVRSKRFGLEEYYSKHGQSISPCQYWVTQVKNKELCSWLRKNIPGTKNLRRFCYQNAYHVSGGYHIVHNDVCRTYAINYIVKQGGDDAYTSWWVEKGQPVVRTQKFGGGYNSSALSSYDNLEMLDTVKFEQGKWYIMATNVLHDVGRIVGLRKSITLDVPAEEEHRILKALNVLI